MQRMMRGKVGGGGDVRVVRRGRVLDKRTEDAVAALAGLLDAVAKGDDVERDVVLLELLREADERALRLRRGVLERRADKDDHALPQVLVLAVLERELRDRDRRRDRRRAPEVGRRLVHGFEDLAELFRVRDQHLRAGGDMTRHDTTYACNRNRWIITR